MIDEARSLVSIMAPEIHDGPFSETYENTYALLGYTYMLVSFEELVAWPLFGRLKI